MSRAAALLTFLKQLKETQAFESVKLYDDDALLITSAYHERILLYMVESNLVTSAVKRTVHKNTLKEIHTLFLVSVDTLPANGDYFARPAEYPFDRAIKLLFDLYWGTIFAYRFNGKTVEVFPVFNAEGQAIYGEPMATDTLNCDDVFVEGGRFTGTYRVANFGSSSSSSSGGGSSTYRVAPFDPLAIYYDVLGISSDASVDTIKQAYREMARKYHPDMADTPDATEKMQQINAAYEAIMKRISV